VQPEGFEQFVQSIFRAEEQELLCSEFFQQLPRFVDLQAGGGDPQASLPAVHHHLGQCPECREVFDALLDAVLADRPSGAF
jgi:hypothetical protein